MHAPAVRHVVEDGSCAPFVVDPRQEGDGPFSVQSTAVGKLDVAVWTAKESCCSVRSSIRTWYVPDASRDSLGIAV